MLAFARGDAQAFDLVFERHRSWLLRFLRGKLRAAGLSGEELAEDIAQDTWMTIVRTSAEYQPSARFTTWLFHIAQQRLVDQLRKLGVNLARTQSLDDENELEGDRNVDESALADLSADPANIFEHRALLTRFASALEALPSEQSEVFMLVAEGGMSLPEVSSALALPLETVKSRLRYARAKLVGVLEELRS
jgi:RNA polymerase sigma factor (sigma-70 family)